MPIPNHSQLLEVLTANSADLGPSVDGPVFGELLCLEMPGIYGQTPQEDLWSMRLTDVVRSHPAPTSAGEPLGAGVSSRAPCWIQLRLGLPTPASCPASTPCPHPTLLTPFRFLLRIFPL